MSALPPDLAPPLQPMLATLARAVPEGAYFFEPKWDGFRCLAFKRGGKVDLRSRNQRPLARYFPEVVEALQALPDDDLVLDGELLVMGPEGFDFPALLARLHPAASRVRLLREQTPARFVAFDLLARGAMDLRERPFAERRAGLASLMEGSAATLVLTPGTHDASTARAWFEQFRGRGIDGLIAKPLDLTYQPGRRAMVKVKHERTVECVVGALRLQADRPVLGSLLLGLYEGGVLKHVGVSSTFTMAKRRELLAELLPGIVPLEGHPWEFGFGIDRNPVGRLAGSAGRWDPAMMTQDWAPLAPVRVCEVGFDQLDGLRFRHPARFIRWRPDRDADSCTLDQLATVTSPISEVLGQ